MSTYVFMLVSHFPLIHSLIFLCHILLNMHENKSKVFEIIPHDLEGNHCEIITSICLCMFSNVITRNIGTSVNEKVLCIPSGMKTSDANVSEELESDNSRGKYDAKGLNMNKIPPPPINNSRLGYDKRKKLYKVVHP